MKVVSQAVQSDRSLQQKEKSVHSEDVTPWLALRIFLCLLLHIALVWQDLRIQFFFYHKSSKLG